MGNEQDCRRNARYAQDQADNALYAVDKASWLRIADGWLAMIPKQAPSLETLALRKPRDC
jgi:hypothetical protein